ncbi:MAG: T9SS type A sorting domain-containing protein [Saprospiraceae bacterium]
MVLKKQPAPGPIENGLIHTNLDFFLRNQLMVSTDDVSAGKWAVRLFPNPANQQVTVAVDAAAAGLTSSIGHDRARALEGVMEDNQHTIDLQFLPAGVYYLRVSGDNAYGVRQLVKL